MEPEPEGSSPYLQAPATGPWIVSTTPHPVSLPKIHSDLIFPPMPWYSKWSLSFGLSQQNPTQFRKENPSISNALVNNSQHMQFFTVGFVIYLQITSQTTSVIHFSFIQFFH
jgi:hypothetical protein